MPTVSEMIEFEWGTKTNKGKVKGATKKDVQFYESFTYDGLRYSLYDSVYLFKDGEADPYIGKIIKIWEPANKSKKVRVLWFFRPSEISNYLGGLETSKNELFLGTGVGTSGSGLDNVNPLEAIAGKCNVVCTSKDERNRQPSSEELTMADYIFYRTFDVDEFTISDKLGEYIGEYIPKVEVRYLLNEDKSAEVVSPGAVPMEREPGTKYSLDIAKHSPVLNSDGAYVGNGEPSEKDNVCDGKMVGFNKHIGVQKNSTTSLKEASSTSHLKMDLDDDGAKYSSDKVKDTNEEKAATFRDHGLKTSSSRKEASSTSHLKTDDDGAKYSSDKVKDTNEEKTATFRDHGLKTSSSPSNVDDIGSLDGRPSKKLKSDDCSRSALKLPASAGKCNLKELTRPAEVSNDRQNNECNKDSHGPFKVKGPVKFADDHLDERPLKKLKPAEPVGAGGKTKAPPSSALDGDSKLKRPVKDSNGANASLHKMKIVDNDKSHLAPSKHSSKKDAKVYGQVVEVTRRPDADNSKWFTGLPWEDTMKAAQEEGTLVLLQNLDPTYTSSEIEDIVWHSFREHCTAKVLHCAAISSPHSVGQAFVIFRTKQAAVRAVQQLEEGCLMLPNGRPILGHVAVGHLPGKSSSFPGHIFIDRIKFPMQKDKREAVSTSHSSQPNTLEYDMAMEWRLIQERSELMRRNLLKKQEEELKKLRGSLKRKCI